MTLKMLKLKVVIPFIGEAESTNQVLILNVNQPDYLDNIDSAETLLEKN